MSAPTCGYGFSTENDHWCTSPALVRVHSGAYDDPDLPHFSAYSCDEHVPFFVREVKDFCGGVDATITAISPTPSPAGYVLPDELVTDAEERLIAQSERFLARAEVAERRVRLLEAFVRAVNPDMDRNGWRWERDFHYNPGPDGDQAIAQALAIRRGEGPPRMTPSRIAMLND